MSAAPASTAPREGDAISGSESKDVARKSGSNFYLSFFSLPKDQREAITAVYAFCREVDDAVDDPAQKDPASLVAAWRDEIARTYDGRPSRPLTQSLALAIERFDLSKAYFDGILDGVAMDLSASRYETFNDLSTYCYHVAGEVGLLCMQIFGHRCERMKEYAIKLGTAFQLTNIVRDIGDDARAGRIYLPQEDLRRFNVPEHRLLAWAGSDPSDSERRNASDGWTAFQTLMAFETQRARRYYRDSAALPRADEWPSLRAAEIMRAIYEDILDRIQRKRYDVFGGRVRVPRPMKMILAAKAWWKTR